MGYMIAVIQNFKVLFIPFSIVLIVLLFFYKHSQTKITKGFVAGWGMFCFLLTAIFAITAASGIGDIGRYGTALIKKEQINLIPFQWSLNGHGITGLVLNAVMFMPLGIMIPLLWRYGSSFFETVLIGAALSLLIEVSQLFNHRVTDIDDLLMNTLGAAIGYGIYCLLFRKLKFLQIDNGAKSFVVRHGALVTVLGLFLLNFLVGNWMLEKYYRF